MKVWFLVIWLCLLTLYGMAQENDYNRSIRTYRENKPDSALQAIERASRSYQRQHKADSLVLAYAHKALLRWETDGLQKGFDVIDTAITLAVNLPPKSVGRVAAYSRLGQLFVQQSDLKSAAVQFEKAERAVDREQPTNRHYILLYNQIALMHLMTERYPLARKYAEQAYALNLRFEGKDGTLMPGIVQTLFFVSNYSDRLQEALKYGTELQRIVQLHYPAGHPIFGVVHNSLALVYETLLQYDKALYHRQLAINLQFKNYKNTKNSFSLGAAYLNMGALYGYLHEGYLSAEYLGKGSKLLMETYGEDGPGMVNILVNLAVSKQHAGDYEEAEKLFQRAYNLQKKHDATNWAEMAYVTSFFGDLYLDQQQYKKAAILYQSALTSYEKAGSEGSKTALLTQNGLAKTFSGTGQPGKAITIQLQVLERFRQIYPAGNDAIAGIIHGISESYFTAGKLAQSLKYSDEVFAELTQVKSWPLHNKKRFLQLPFSYNTSVYVKHRVGTQLALYRKTQNKRFLEEALSFVDQYSDFISGNLHLFRTQASLVELAEVNKAIYSIAVEACWGLSGAGKNKGLLARAFSYSELGKAFLLKLAANNMMVDAEQVKSNPTAKQDKQFRAQLSALNLQYLRADDKDSLLTLLTAKMEQYRIFQDSLKRAGDKLLNTKQHITVYSLNSIREKLLKKKQTLIEYSVTDESLFIFVLSADTFYVTRTGKKVLQDIAALKNLHGLRSEQFTGPAYRLYHRLIKPVEQYFSSTRLLIVPDADLYYLNFETLINKPGLTDFSQMSYLIRKYNISYLLSAASAIQFKDAHQAARTDRALLFAPVFTDDMKNRHLKGQITPLGDESIYQYLYRQPFALKAAIQIGRYIPGDLFTEQRAGERAFKNAAPDYRVLHLGTHAEVNDLSPLQSRLFFARTLPEDTTDTDDGYLYAYEIYAMHLKADLAVLTACETGGGVLHQGEGVISLAYSFMYAGCSSVIMSLWNIDDKTSAEIITEFYRLLAEGKSKSEALRLSKLQYLNKATATMAHPYYWAGLTLVGDDAAVYTTSFHWLWYLLGSVILVCVSFMILRKYFKTIVSYS
ncbi:MAG: CHAT domain-containing protein [Sphingobacteriaceae bacterium]|nr:MAG: CHAT domain-containing protein [Sphingobacteriaceae bacterium]